MKKICYLTTIKDSISAFFIPQLNYLSENGFEVTVISDRSLKYSKELSERVRRIDIDIPRGVSFLGTVRSIIVLEKIFKKERYDMVQYSTLNASFSASIAAIIAGIRIRNYHIMGIRYQGFTGIKRMIFRGIEKLTCAMSTSVECVSKGIRQFGIDENIFKADKAVVVWNGSTGGVDVKRFDISKRDIWRSAIRDQLGIAQDEFVFLFAGRITRDKGINELLKAFMNLHMDAKLVLVGNQEGIDTLDAGLWEKATADDNIIIRPAVINIEEYYAAADCLVLPSYREGFGNVLIESACTGTICIASDIPGPTEIIDNIGGYKCRAKDTHDLRDKMRIVVRNRHKTIPGDIAERAALFYDADTLNKEILKRKQKLLGL